jgi:hypothetical protein
MKSSKFDRQLLKTIKVRGPADPVLVRGAAAGIKPRTPAEMLGRGPRPWGEAKAKPQDIQHTKFPEPAERAIEAAITKREFNLEVQHLEVVELFFFLSAKGAECNSQGQSAERSEARRPWKVRRIVPKL